MRLGVPVLVTDHHLPGAVLPRAEVMVNPNLAGSRFASPALAGVGVAFYVMAALARLLSEENFRVADFLDLVALGTVADMVPLDRNNRDLGLPRPEAHSRRALRGRHSRAARISPAGMSKRSPQPIWPLPWRRG